MSMLDSFFNKGFKGAKCKTLLKLTIPRIKLLRNRRDIQLKQMRRDIAKLLENGQEATARIRVEHIIREENMMAAQEIIELFCELIAVRLPIIETQRECPLDLKEAISSICFAAPRCSDLPELQQVQMLFATKYGREFVASASELMPDCGVNRQIIELLSVRAPSVEAKLKILKEIAEEHEVDWDPAASESEFLKAHEDLLNGPNHIISGSTLPLPKEKHEESILSKMSEENEEFNSDSGFDSLDLPEVPKAYVRAAADNPEVENPEPSVPVNENRQFEFSPSTSSQSKQVDRTPSLASPPSPVFPSNHSEPTPPVSSSSTEAGIDLQDVLAAAQAAAETADRAAAAARAAASLAQVRITELVAKRNGNASCGSEKNESHVAFHQQDSVSYADPFGSGSSTLSGSPETKEDPRHPQRSTSMEDDPYFSYPNLFSRQDSGLNAGAYSSIEHDHL